MKKLIYLLSFLLFACGNYPFNMPKSAYLDVQTMPQDATSIFASIDTDIIRIKFKPFVPSYYFSNNYGYWQTRPLWFDFNFYHGNYYSYYSGFYRPWNYWDYYMRPWTPANNWAQGPFNNQGYNVVYNSTRRSSIENNIITRPSRSRVILNKKPVITYKPAVNYNNNSKPSYNNSKPSFNNKPSFNSTPSYNNSRPSFNNSKPSYNSSTRTNTLSLNKKGGKN